MAAQKPGRCDGAEGQYNLARRGEGANEEHDAFVGSGGSSSGATMFAWNAPSAMFGSLHNDGSEETDGRVRVIYN